VAVSAAKIGLLRAALGGDADRVAFADIADVGANPARIIPAWRDFAAVTDGGRHARGTLRIWRDAGALVCEVRDGGRLQNPMVGRERPTPERDGGRGLWMVDQLCDLVQLRSFPDGAAVRAHVYLP
jgi:hypothetical protein